MINDILFQDNNIAISSGLLINYLFYTYFININSLISKDFEEFNKHNSNFYLLSLTFTFLSYFYIYLPVFILFNFKFVRSLIKKYKNEDKIIKYSITNSSMIDCIAYDSSNKIIYIKFNNTATFYKWNNIEYRIFEKLIPSSDKSVGQEFNKLKKSILKDDYEIINYETIF